MARGRFRSWTESTLYTSGWENQSREAVCFHYAASAFLEGLFGAVGRGLTETLHAVHYRLLAICTKFYTED